MSKANITVVGIDGTRTLGLDAIAAIKSAGTILTSTRLDELFKEYDLYNEVKDKLKVESKIDAIMNYLQKASEPVVVLASGDPMFFGLGKIISEAFSIDEVRICPGLSSVQLGFAKARMHWQDAYFISLHGSMKREWTIMDIPLVLERHPKLAILTGGENTPGRISEHLPGHAQVIVLERLGYEDENMHTLSAKDVRAMEFKNPNLMIVTHECDNKPVLGFTESEFRHEKGLITKDEIRAVVIHKLRLPLKGVLWDIGSGSGSVAIESKRLSPSLEVYAVEKNPSRINDIEYNAAHLRAGNISVIKGEAPEVLDVLPAPNRVFIGGSGDDLADVIKHVDERMKSGVLVITAITLESLHGAVDEMKSAGLKYDISSVSVSRAETVGSKEYMKAMNQIFIIKAVK